MAVGAMLTVLVTVLAGCANIPDQSTPQAVANLGTQSPGATPLPDPKADPLTVVRNFIGEAGNPDAAKGYLTDAAKASWQSDAPPTIIAETFGTAPIPPPERKAQGDDGGNDYTVVLTVTLLGRLGPDRAFVPRLGTAEYRVVVHRQTTEDPWRIQTPPPDVLITMPAFNLAYQRVSVYYFDPEFRVVVPDRRYIPAKPLVGAPDRVIRLLLDGPSAALEGAVKTAIPTEAQMGTNAVADSDGALVVNLTKLGDQTPEDRQLIAVQVVLSLKDVVQTKIRLLADGHTLISDHKDWRQSDVPSWDLLTRPNPDLPGMFTAAGKVYSLRGGGTIQGPAGNGELKVISAAQSIDGKSLAVVHEVPTGARLRVGGIGPPMREVELAASTLTRPTWMLGASNAGSNEVWTVQNGVEVVRVVRTANESWAPSPVISSELHSFGSTITDLRLSRDGVRVAAVISGQVVVASVVRAKDTVSIHAPRILRTGELTTVVGVDWLNQDTLVVATGQADRPVVNVPVDGFEANAYNRSNLDSAITAIAAAPDRLVLVADGHEMWEASEIRQIWNLHPTPVAGARPFYPG